MRRYKIASERVSRVRRKFPECQDFRALLERHRDELEDITVPRFPPLRKTLSDLRSRWHSEGVPHSSTIVTAQQ